MNAPQSACSLTLGYALGAGLRALFSNGLLLALDLPLPQLEPVPLLKRNSACV